MNEDENKNDIDIEITGGEPQDNPVEEAAAPETGEPVLEAADNIPAAPETEPFSTKDGQGGNPGPGPQQYPFPGQPNPQFGGQYQYGYPQQVPPPQYGYGKPAQPYYMPPQYQQPAAQFGRVPPPPPPTKGKKKGLKVFFVLLSVILVFALVASGFAIGRNMAPKGGEDTTATTSGGPSLNISETPSDSNQASTPGGGISTVEVAAKVKPSVVGILVYNQQNSFTSENDAASGEGSGIIMGMDANGEYTYIITCAHVISETNAGISIQLEDGTKQEAELVGYDLRTDVGVIKVKMTGLTAAEFGNSAALKVGEQVFAVGNPGGTEFFGSFTSGVVSAIDRPVNSEIGYTMESIQHDAAINPGNSGGALVNTAGQVIGINSLKIIDTNYEGMGFAIPITSAKVIVDDIIQYGYVPNRPKLGITYYSASSSQTYSMIVQLKGLPSGTLYINEISADSSLANTEAQKGDLIIAVNGKNLDTASVLLEIIDNAKVGDTLKLKLCRVNKGYQISEFEVEVTLVEDKGNGIVTPTEEPTTIDPFEYFNNPWN